jgi:PhnB protein
MASLNPYLNFNGNAEEAFNFYKSVFGGEFVTLQRYKDTPEAGEVSEKDKDKIMHIALPIDGNILMATDALESMGQKVNPGNNFFLSIDTKSTTEAEEVFNKLSSKGKVTMPLEDTFWGSYFGMCTDKFGIQWMISYDKKDQK